MRSPGRIVPRGLIILALALASCDSVAVGAELADQLRELFDLGSNNTPTAVAAAKVKYDKIMAHFARHPRAEYAYGVVLMNQHKYAEASAAFARYIAAGDPDPNAYMLQIAALVPRRDYGKALQQSIALANYLRNDSPSVSGPSRTEAAKFLGTLFKYFEIARPGAVDVALLKRSKLEALAMLDEKGKPAFEEGADAVAKRTDELLAEQESREAESKSRIAGRKERDKQLVEKGRTTGEAAEAKTQVTQEQLRALEQQCAELQKRMTPLAAQRDVTTSAITFRQSQLSQNAGSQQPNPAVDQALRNEIAVFQRQVAELDRELGPLRASSLQLEQRAASHHLSLNDAENAARKNERIEAQAARRIERAEDQLARHPRGTDGRFAVFATYAPFSYDLERKRVLDWFAPQTPAPVTELGGR